ncbi:NAD(P)/FAD-dependent oxidoreductase [Streptomyces sp. SID13726]|uniref:NAD(P)/FAD-dependent oxidoreductase n=1 Tax=Streptomyces sp. SID13726 TaxID=2706058 RepID=UPI0013BB962C|nr:NAD(P)/FAD-dependent oxidoreductase [Streptomyces sp. SID13726]NEA97980.1 FAD-dependent oxidoreductase [Streptomyces sp. SID13726]
MSEPSLAVIGAGPAGLAATLAAASRGIHVTLIDSAAEAGGQFYRRPAPELGARRPQALHHQWRTWEKLRDGLRSHVQAGTVSHVTDHHVWFVERNPTGFTVHALLGPEQEQPAEVRADAVLLATGGYEKVLPFPGWTLPGVVAAGGAQAMLKGGLVLPGRTAVVAGTGPLLLPVATGLAAAGATVAALVDSADPKAFLRRSRALAAQPGKVAEGARYAGQLARHRVRTLLHHTVVAAHGTERIEAVTVAALDGDGRVRPGTRRRLGCDTLAVGHGMLPHTDLADALGCRIDGTDVYADAEQRTDVPGVWAAGETTGIGGAALSLAEGHIAGRSIAARLTGREPDPAEWAAAARIRTRSRAFFAAVDSVYAPPAHWAEQVTDDTVVCRCEEVPAGAVREAVRELGAGDLRTVKLLTRAGMGWCQGRVCGPGVAGIAGCAQTPGRRPFARPVPLGVLAGSGSGSGSGSGEGGRPGEADQPGKSEKQRAETNGDQ